MARNIFQPNDSTNEGLFAFLDEGLWETMQALRRDGLIDDHEPDKELDEMLREFAHEANAETMAVMKVTPEELKPGTPMWDEFVRQSGETLDRRAWRVDTAPVVAEPALIDVPYVATKNSVPNFQGIADLSPNFQIIDVHIPKPLEDPDRIRAYDLVCLEAAREETEAAPEAEATRAIECEPFKKAVREDPDEYGLSEQDSLGYGTSADPDSGVGMN